MPHFLQIYEEDKNIKEIEEKKYLKLCKRNASIDEASLSVICFNAMFNSCILQSIAGHLILEMKHMSASSMKLHQCLIYETL